MRGPPTLELIWEVVRRESAFWLFCREAICMKEYTGSPGLKDHRGEVLWRLDS